MFYFSYEKENQVLRILASYVKRKIMNRLDHGIQRISEIID